jgi:hypothetical protein
MQLSFKAGSYLTIFPRVCIILIMVGSTLWT